MEGKRVCVHLSLWQRSDFSHLAPEILRDDDPHVTVHEEVCLEISHLQIPT